MKITIAQLNPTIGDIDGNLTKLKHALSFSCEDSPDLVVFPELFLIGYPPYDFLQNDQFVKKAERGVQEIVEESTKYPRTGILFGTVQHTGKEVGTGFYNSALLVCCGEILASRHKSLLPTYDVFDEARFFDSAPNVQVVEFKDEILGISICEDAWNDQSVWRGRYYPIDPMKALAEQGTSLFINLSASPFHAEKDAIRYRLFQNHVRKYSIPLLFVNQVGGNDELVFDGKSMYIDSNGKPALIFPSFEEHIETIDTATLHGTDPYVPEEKIESVFRALILGIKDYMSKCGFSKAVLGLSGGIDSAVTCSLAAEAVGSENVLGISMPSLYSSKGSIEDSRKLAENLGISFKVIPISDVFSSYCDTLQEHFAEKAVDVTEENIQARIRGNILMAFSNKFGHLVLSTGNKSELAVGYCTLYGDMSGGLAVLSDVPKTMVYKLAEYINRRSEIIPREIIKKPPSAELKPGQLDQDTLPPYEVLDKVLFLYLDEGFSGEEIVRQGFDPKLVQWLVEIVDKNEYKRRQGAPGLKVTSKAFGMGRRMPIAARFVRL
ncbi:MAG: NAD+ synthase [Pseudomonadota bacterium]